MEHNVKRGLSWGSREVSVAVGGEEESVTGDRVVERLDPEPVPRQEEAALQPVPQGKREHALEPLDTGCPLLLVQVEDRLGIAPGPVGVAAPLEPATELGMVVNFAVGDDPGGPL